MEHSESIYTIDDVMKMLDSFFFEPASHWDGFYEDRSRPMPFFVDVPDASLKSFFDSGKLSAGRVLELGCGNGRNAIYMAQQGCEVDAVDASPKAVAWAEEKVADNSVSVNLICKSIFDLVPEPSSYDIVYDGGCFHHIPPHRRITYVGLINTILKPNGYFCMYCFLPGTEYSPEDRTDWEVYRRRGLDGGFAFSKIRLQEIFEPSGFKLVEYVTGRDIPRGADTFDRSFLHTVLFQKQ